MSNCEGIVNSPVASRYSALRAALAWSAALESWSGEDDEHDGGRNDLSQGSRGADSPGRERLRVGGLRSIAGSEMSPIAMTVAPTMPVVAASRAPTKTTEMPSPPGTGPKSWAIVTSRSSAILERWSMMPHEHEEWDRDEGVALHVPVEAAEVGDSGAQPLHRARRGRSRRSDRPAKT